jgi:hypothetical protein
MKYYKHINLHNLHNFDNLHNLNDLITEYYTIDKYEFDDNYKRLEEYILKKFKKNTNQIFKFNLSMINDELYNKIEKIVNNYKKAFLYKIDDNYIIKYRNFIDNNYKSNNFKINLNNIFYNDLSNLINLKKINKIIDTIDVDIIKNKLYNNLLYTKSIKACIYDNFYKNIKNNHIITNYLDTLNAEDYTIFFNIKSDNTEHNINEFKNVLNKLENINNNINNIITNNNNFKNEYNINNLYNISYINKIYKNIKDDTKDIYIKMNDIYDMNFELIKKENYSKNNITLNQFTNQIVEFLNRFLKKKITKIINSIFYDYLIS